MLFLNCVGWNILLHHFFDFKVLKAFETLPDLLDLVGDLVRILDIVDEDFLIGGLAVIGIPIDEQFLE